MIKKEPPRLLGWCETVLPHLLVRSIIFWGGSPWLSSNSGRIHDSEKIKSIPKEKKQSLEESSGHLTSCSHQFGDASPQSLPSLGTRKAQGCRRGGYWPS